MARAKKDNSYIAAAVQAAPVFMDIDATIDKGIRLIHEAAKEGATLIAGLARDDIPPQEERAGRNLQTRNPKGPISRRGTSPCRSDKMLIDCLQALASPCTIHIQLHITGRRGAQSATSLAL